MDLITRDPESAALDVFRGDWDEGGTVSVHLPATEAVDILDRLGWQHAEGRWVSPNGFRSWHIDEALQIALVSTVQS